MGLDELQAASFGRSSTATADSLDVAARMPGPTIDRFLADHIYAGVATTRPDGRPHAAMTGYLVHDEVVWLPVMRGTARARNVAAQPYACVIVSEGEGDVHAMVMLEGPAAVVEEPPIDMLDRWDAVRGSRPDWAVGWIRVGIEKVFSYAAVGSRYRS